MKALRQRFHDWRHERRIAALSREVGALIRAHDYAEARRRNKALVAAILARSPGQVARMQKRRGWPQT